MPEECPACGVVPGDPFERPWTCPACETFFAELRTRD